MGFPEGWTIGDALDDKVSDVDSLRYHALGNAVTPPVAEWIAGRIANYLINADKAVLESSMVNEPLAACV